MPLLFLLFLSSCASFIPSLLAQAPTSLQPALNDQHQWGAQNDAQAWIIPPIYDTLYTLPRTRFDHSNYNIHYYPSTYWIGKRNNKQVVLNSTGAILCKVDAVLPRLMGNAILIKKGNQWGLRTLKGKTLLPTRCSKVTWYGDVLGLYYRDQWYLFDAQEGHLYPKGGVDEVQARQVSPRHQLLLVRVGDQWGVLNNRLVELLPLEYFYIALSPSPQPIQHLSQVQFVVKNEEGYGLLNIAGDWSPLP